MRSFLFSFGFKNTRNQSSIELFQIKTICKEVKRTRNELDRKSSFNPENHEVIVINAQLFYIIPISIPGRRSIMDKADAIYKDRVRLKQTN